MNRYAWWAGILLSCGVLSACSGEAPEESVVEHVPQAPVVEAPTLEPTVEPTATPTAEPTATPTPEPTATPEPPDLDSLTLVGIIGGRTPAALIEHEGTQEMFRAGDLVFDLGTVKQVSGDSVVIEANGQEATLALPVAAVPAAPPPVPEPEAEVVPTPVTGGELTLAGIIGGRSLAALINYGDAEEMFRAGDDVFGQGRLKIVGKDSVVITGSDGDVTLSLPVAATEPEPTPEPALVDAVTPAPAPPPPVARVISRAKAQTAFARFSDVLSAADAVAARIGKTPGIGFGEIPANSFLRVLGLKSGDVLQEINGIALGDPTELPDLSGIAKLGSISVTCVRDGVGLTFSRPIR